MRSFSVAAFAAALVLVGPAGAAAAAPKDYCADLKGANTGQTCQIQMADPGYNVDISFPANYPDEQLVADFISKQRDDFLNAAKSSAPRDQPYQLTITSAKYGSAIPPRGTEAVVLKVVQNTGAGPHTTYKSFNWDQAYRKEIVWTAAADDKKNTPLWRVDDPLATVAPIVQSELQKQTAPPANPNQPAPPANQPASPTPTAPSVTVASAAAYDPANYQSFAITNDGVIFFFDQGRLLPDSAGAPQVLVPRSAIDPMLA
ncbi:DUF3298 domain-containing protein [Mycobacterium avium subsp. hominissuis]|uniref:RsiV family protein n=1 Tax=Mycobacterium avium TaxID=1764 RepID=UPI0003927390|nr:RsiV family protein [Mycobacterium avium]ETB00671.1 hypothetical protein O982_03170 [Mycobacterium avium 10-5581]ATO64024.2 DUF3298 domain-containing protein [Mycobacterium avium subsp. hominissuis]ATO68578.1 RsiV family protein [Mycobacterium avium subsp. hominissuis]ATO73119.1 RsiV family protein [Mycobacterium avium subsp. hominissuis]PBD10667.1 DUF3298 domain-containing protein [Mycobacterium avium subsp. hominissuis]